MKKEFKEILEEALTQGWRWRETKDGGQLLAPDGVGIVTVHKTPSDRRALNNFIAELRRRGFRWPPQR